MRIIRNEKYYKLKCIEYFSENGIVVFEKRNETLITFFFCDDSRWYTDMYAQSWKHLYKFREDFKDVIIHNLWEAKKYHIESEVN